MKQAEDFLQELIEQVESGRPVEATMQGLPEAEADLVQFISAMRQIPYPVEEEAVVAMQELEFIKAASAQFPPTSLSTVNNQTSSQIWKRLTQWISMLLNQAEYGMVALAVLALVIWGVFRFADSPEEDLAIVEDAVPVETAVSTPTQSTRIAEESASEPPNIAPTATDFEPPTALTMLTAPDQPHENNIYVPVVGVPIERNPQTAVIDNIVGFVEVQDANGEWTAVSHVANLIAGQRLRTGALSQATLTFYDGSQATIAAASEILIEQLNALQPAQGFRTVVMTQWVGESNHSVQFRSDGGSRYEVKTPTGSGIARGTEFQVLVMPSERTRFVVTEGKVDVSNANSTVSVVGGQLTSFVKNEAPQPATFFIQGEGEVESIGERWTVAGQQFITNNQTVIVGNPQVGDLVKIEGRLMDDGSQLADRIILLQRSLNNRFTISGEVSQIDDSWIVAGQEILVNENTAVTQNVTVGDDVIVTGAILQDGTLVAERITKQYTEFGLPFSFSGVVQEMSSHRWVISGQVIQLAEESAILGAISIGSVVQVHGVILDTEWVAVEILAVDPTLTSFEFTGIVNQTGNWIVGGIPFEVRDWSQIEPDIIVGSEVQVAGSILADGSRVATSITLVESVTVQIVKFTGLVNSIDPWIVNGLPLHVNDDSKLLGNIQVGVRVKVKAALLSNGQWQVIKMRALNPNFGLGCYLLSSPITAVTNGGIQLKHWPVEIINNRSIVLPAGLKIDDVITLPICTGWNGEITIIGEITLVYRPIIVIINPGIGGDNNVPEGCRITPKGNIKCTRRSSRRS